MNEFQFKQAAKRKTWIFPLIVIVLLYITIPVLLINKGGNNFEKALTYASSDPIQAANYFNSANVFSDFAGNFPGFSGWANSLINRSKQKVQAVYQEECGKISKKTQEEQISFCKDWKTFSEKTHIKLPECEITCP